ARLVVLAELTQRAPAPRNNSKASLLRKRKELIPEITGQARPREDVVEHIEDNEQALLVLVELVEGEYQQFVQARVCYVDYVAKHQAGIKQPLFRSIKKGACRLRHLSLAPRRRHSARDGRDATSRGQHA